MTHREAIIRILAKHGHPLHYAHIVKTVLRRRWLRSTSSVNAGNGILAVLSKGRRSREGDFFRVAEGVYGLRVWVRRKLRKLVRRRVREQGFVLSRDGSILHENPIEKETVRDFHRYARQIKFKENERFLKANAAKLICCFADGSQVSVPNFHPRLVEVKSESLEADLFRFATLLWSAPVSHGFGRRIRFLVFDDWNGKLVGLFALGDPVFNLKPRDEWVGWDHKQREERLYHVMDIFVLGAVPPYSELLCGKLIALLAASSEVRETVRAKYSGTTTIIQDKTKDSRLVLLTTTSALGRSSLYNRVTFRDRLVYERIGATEGWGHFHLRNGTFTAMRKYLEGIGHPIVSAHQYGNGPNWRMRLARTCLTEVGLSQDLLKHGIKRELYAVRLASNFKEFLRGQTKKPNFYSMPVEDIGQYFKERWMAGRATRRPDYITRDRSAVLEWIYALGNPIAFDKE